MGLPPKGVTRRFGRLKKATNSLPITRGDLCPLPVAMSEEAPPLNLYLFLFGHTGSSLLLESLGFL